MTEKIRRKIIKFKVRFYITASEIAFNLDKCFRALHCKTLARVFMRMDGYCLNKALSVALDYAKERA